MNGSARLVWLSFLVVMGAGCTRSFVLEEDGGGRRSDASRDSAVPGDGGADTAVVLPSGKCERPSKIDLLFVIDNSASTIEEQVAVARELPSLIGVLSGPPDSDGDGEPDYPAIDDIHLGVVTTDMGTGGFSIPTCAEPDFGDDAILRTEGNTTLSGCMATAPPFLSYRGGDALEGFAERASCVLVAGSGGCGFEQPLEAALKAVTPASAPLVFAAGSRGHGTDANEGFLRADSMLGVVVVSDEDDCSARDAELFNPSSEIAVGELSLRCSNNRGMLHPLTRYVEGFRSLRPGRPDLLTFAVIAGVPRDLTPEGVTDTSAIDRILADERMEERRDSTMPSRLEPSCNEGGHFAFPPRRLVSLARALPDQSVVASLCQDDWTESIRTIGQTMGRRACAAYLPD